MVLDRYNKIDEMKWNEFLEWYSSNVGKYITHSVMVADRVDFLNAQSNERIGGIYFTPDGNEYYVRTQEYDEWIKR